MYIKKSELMAMVVIVAALWHWIPWDPLTFLENLTVQVCLVIMAAGVIVVGEWLYEHLMEKKIPD